MLLRALPFLLLLAYAGLMLAFSVWQTRRLLDQKSAPLAEPTLQAVAARLATTMGLPGFDLRVLDLPMVNALAGPDGKVYLTRGFLEAFRNGRASADEMASVIAHELGHLGLGHLRRRMIDITGQNAVFLLLGTLLNRFLPGVGFLLARAISTALMARLSRRDEFQADAFATSLLIKAGYGTAPQKALFAKLGALTGQTGAHIPEWARSHPSAEDRIAAITANELRWGLS